MIRTSPAQSPAFPPRRLRPSLLALVALVLATGPGVDAAEDPPAFSPRDVFELEWASDPRISPDGERVVYVRNFMDVMSDRRRSQLHGGHLASEKQNESSIGICLVGNFDTGWVSRKQRESLIALVLYLMDRCKLDSDDVKTHSQINVVPTRCPGKHFPTGTILKEIKESS
jgi:hypothetical protein